MSQDKLLFLNANDVSQCLSIPQAIEAMRSAFTQLSDGQANVPVRVPMNLKASGDGALFMPVYLPAEEMVGLKLVMIHPKNPGKGLPMIHAFVTIMDADSGRPIAIMDGEKLTAVRTGAASGLATDLLARKDAGVAAIFGAGVQGRTQLAAVAAVRKLESAIIFDRDSKRCATFAAEMSEQLNIPIQTAKSAAELSAADIICTATSSNQPVFLAEHLKFGAHINGVGSFRPDMAEVPADIVINSKIVVDQREAALKEAGDILQPMQFGDINEKHIYAELGEVCSGKKPGRENETEITFFKSVGNAVQDLAAASVVIKNALKNNIGQQLSL